MNENNQNFSDAINVCINSMKYLIKQAFQKKATKIYDGLITSSAGNGAWNIKVNGKIHALKPYGSITPAVNMMVKVVVPQGNFSKAFFF